MRGSAVFVAALAAAIVGARAGLAQSVEPGYGSDSIPIASGSAFVGGFEILGNGDYAVFDGTSVVEESPVDGSVVKTLFTPPLSVFGAFLTLSPDQAKLYFGESSYGKIYEIDVAAGGGVEVASLVYPYDLAFDPQGRAFVAYATGLFTGSHVALLDLSSGSWTDVFDSPEASGPVAFDAAGDLFTTTPDSSSFPPPPDSTELYLFTAAQIDQALTSGTPLTPADGQLLAQLDDAVAIALDDGGDCFATDAFHGIVTEISAGNLSETTFATAASGVGYTYLRFRPGTVGVFEPWQPEDSGKLVALRTDFFSINEADRFRPVRPTLATTPASPVPPGSFTLDVSGAVPNGFGWMLLAPAGTTSSEFGLRNRTWPAPLFLGLDLSGGLLLLPITTDGAGAASFSAVNPGVGGISIGFQLVVGAAASGPYYGTSNPLELVLQ